MSKVNAKSQSGIDEHQCVEELSWNAEEMSFIRVFGERLEVAAMYPEPPLQILAGICEPLRRAVRAEALVYVQHKSLMSDSVESDAESAVVWAGTRLLDDPSCHRLAQSRVRRIIDNKLQEDVALQGSDVQSAVVICVGNIHLTSGYFIALNSRHPDGFGTREAGLLRTVAALLIVYIKGYSDAPLPFEVDACEQ